MITREALLAWAEEAVRKCPTFRSQNKSRPNTVERVLGLLAARWYASGNADLSGGEVVDVLASLYYGGCRGYIDYSVDAIIDEILGSLGEESEDCRFANVEELVEECGLTDTDIASN